MARHDFPTAQHPWLDETEPREGRDSRRLGVRVWCGLVVLALLFALTVDPTFSLPVGCLICGWEEIRVARWLKRTDPVPSRGRTCSRFHLACGLWKVALMALLLMCVIGFVQAANEGRPEPGSREAELPPAFAGCVLTLIVGFLLASAASIVAAISALRHQVRVWVGPEAHWAFAEEIWPPQLARRRRETSNRAKLILLTALITSSLSGLMFVILSLSFLIPRESKSPGIVVGITMFLLIGIPFLILRSLDQLTARMVAPSPSACWTLDFGNDRQPA